MKNILIIMTQEKELKIADEASIQKRILLKHFTKKKRTLKMKRYRRKERFKA